MLDDKWCLLVKVSAILYAAIMHAQLVMYTKQAAVCQAQVLFKLGGPDDTSLDTQTLAASRGPQGSV